MENIRFDQFLQDMFVEKQEVKCRKEGDDYQCTQKVQIHQCDDEEKNCELIAEQEASLQVPGDKLDIPKKQLSSPQPPQQSPMESSSQQSESPESPRSPKSPSLEPESPLQSPEKEDIQIESISQESLNSSLQTSLEGFDSDVTFMTNNLNESLSSLGQSVYSASSAGSVNFIRDIVDQTDFDFKPKKKKPKKKSKNNLKPNPKLKTEKTKKKDVLKFEDTDEEDDKEEIVSLEEDEDSNEISDVDEDAAEEEEQLPERREDEEKIDQKEEKEPVHRGRKKKVRPSAEEPEGEYVDIKKLMKELQDQHYYYSENSTEQSF